MTAQELGKIGEDYACAELLKKGYRLIVKNYRWQRAEIDLIMQDGSEMIFIEVKTRNSIFFGAPYQAVTRSKQKQIIKAANAFIVESDFNGDARFDVISIVKNQNETAFQHIPNAFSPSL